MRSTHCESVCVCFTASSANPSTCVCVCERRRHRKRLQGAEAASPEREMEERRGLGAKESQGHCQLQVRGCLDPCERHPAWPVSSVVGEVNVGAQLMLTLNSEVLWWSESTKWVGCGFSGLSSSCRERASGWELRCLLRICEAFRKQEMLALAPRRKWLTKSVRASVRLGGASSLQLWAVILPCVHTLLRTMWWTLVASRRMASAGVNRKFQHTHTHAHTYTHTVNKPKFSFVKLLFCFLTISNIYISKQFESLKYFVFYFPMNGFQNHDILCKKKDLKNMVFFKNHTSLF